MDTQQLFLLEPPHCAMDMRDDQWIKASKCFVSLYDAKQTYISLIKQYSLGHLYGKQESIATEND